MCVRERGNVCMYVCLSVCHSGCEWMNKCFSSHFTFCVCVFPLLPPFPPLSLSLSNRLLTHSHFL